LPFANMIGLTSASDKGRSEVRGKMSATVILGAKEGIPVGNVHIVVTDSDAMAHSK